MGYGPPECSSSTSLATLPGVRWDVNGYYRELGVLPSATRKQLRIAYMEKDGQSSARLTYIFKQLLNAEVRREYDLTPLGELFMDDYVRAMLDRKIKDEAHKRAVRLQEEGVAVDMLDLSSFERDAAAEMGVNYAPDTPDEVVDGNPSGVQDGPRPAKFDYAYYLWALRPSLEGTEESTVRLVRLAEWQRLLVRALSREGLRLKFAVGLHGKPHRWVEASIGYRTVFLLNVFEDPSEELATQVAQGLARASKVAPEIRAMQHQQPRSTPRIHITEMR